MGCVRGSTSQVRQRVHGKSEMPGHHCQNAQSGGISRHVRHRSRVRRHRQGYNALHDVTITERPHCPLLQP